MGIEISDVLSDNLESPYYRYWNNYNIEKGKAWFITADKIHEQTENAISHVKSMGLSDNAAKVISLIPPGGGGDIFSVWYVLGMQA